MCVEKGSVVFFDSGIGGLTVMNACRKAVPNIPFYYYGDNERAPYGNLPPEKIKEYVLEVFEKFSFSNARAIVLACNTATAICLEELRKRYSVPIVGIEPAVLQVAKKGGEILIICTRATHASKRFGELLEKSRLLYPQARLRAVACADLAGEIENHLLDRVYDYAPFLPLYKPNFVVLGCTHYSFIKEQIEAFYGCKSCNGNEGIVSQLSAILAGQVCVESGNGKGGVNFWDCQPQRGIFNPDLGKMTTEEHDDRKTDGERIKTNKSLCVEAEKIEKNDEVKTTFFVGKSKEKNRFIYEHLFV